MFKHCFALLALAACGSDHQAALTDAAKQIDAALDSGAGSDAPTVHQKSVISAITLPPSATEAHSTGFDINQDGEIDNNLGSLFSTLKTLGADLQPSITTAVDHGASVSLIDLAASSFTDATAAKVTLYGATSNITPAPCTDADDLVCRHHLDGTGQFEIDSNVTPDVLNGSIAAGSFSGAGDAMITLAFAAQTIPLDLVHAQITMGSSSNVLGGAVPAAEVHTRIAPAVAVQARVVFAMHCSVGGTPGSCGCTGAGATYRALFDKAPSDCMISDAEVDAYLSTLVAPDIDTDNDSEYDALSLGVSFSTVAAAF